MPIADYPANRAGLTLAAAILLAGATSAMGAQTEAEKKADDALFARYPVSSVYHGPIHLPDFKGRDRKFSGYRTRIRDGMRDGVNLAGHYAGIYWGCGTECVVYVIGDVATGKVINFPYGGEDYPQFRIDTRPDSRLMIATWVAYDQRFLDAAPGANVPDIRTCFRQTFVWNGSLPVALSMPVETGSNNNNPGMEPDCDNP